MEKKHFSLKWGRRMVAINMEMPKSCMSCPKKHGCNIGCFSGWLEDKRADDCPLVEIGTCKDCKHLKVWRSGRRKGLYCGLHTEADFCFEVEENFYCTYFEKKGSCKDCRAWRPRGGENGFCARSPHGRKADESCENFEKRGAENE